MCGNCSDCPFVDAPVNKLFYEIHITIRNGAHAETFMEFGETHGLKPIKIANFNLNNEFVNYDYMTSYKVTDGRDPFQVMGELQTLISSEFQIVRSKIETVPWHPLCNMDTFPTGYFEAHFKIDGDVDITDFAPPGFTLFKSKRVLEGSLAPSTMLTFRFATIRTSFEECVRYIVEYYKKNEIKLADTPIIEYALYDSNIGHDKEWTQ